MNDAELVRRCADGEPAAWDEIVRLHTGLLYAIAARTLGARRGAQGSGADPDAEDVVQAVFQKLWDDGRRRLRTFEGRSRLSTWLAVLARREALDRVRSGRAGRRETLQDAAALDTLAAPRAERNGHFTAQSLDGDEGPVASLAAREERERLLEGVDSLPPRDRLLVRLVHLDGCSYAEVARLLAVPENSISPWLARARERLRAALTPRRGAAGPDPDRPYGTDAPAPLKGRSETP